jgi:hypothetical protein
MTMGYGLGSVPSSYSSSDEVLAHSLAEECLLPKAAAAQKAGKFKAEIFPVKSKVTVKGVKLSRRSWWMPMIGSGMV